MGKKAAERRLKRRIARKERKERILKKKIQRAEKKGKFGREERLKARLGRVERKEEQLRNRLENIDDIIRRRHEKLKKAFVGGKNFAEWVANNKAMLLTTIEVLADAGTALAVGGLEIATLGIATPAMPELVGLIQVSKIAAEGAVNKIAIAGNVAMAADNVAAVMGDPDKQPHEAISAAGKEMARLGKEHGNEKMEKVGGALQDNAKTIQEKYEKALKAKVLLENIGGAKKEIIETPLGEKQVVEEVVLPKEDLSKKSVKELKMIAKNMGIKKVSKLKKAELIDIIDKGIEFEVREKKTIKEDPKAFELFRTGTNQAPPLNIH